MAACICINSSCHHFYEKLSSWTLLCSAVPALFFEKSSPDFNADTSKTDSSLAFDVKNFHICYWYISHFLCYQSSSWTWQPFWLASVQGVIFLGTLLDHQLRYFWDQFLMSFLSDKPALLTKLPDLTGTWDFPVAVFLALLVAVIGSCILALPAGDVCHHAAAFKTMMAWKDEFSWSLILPVVFSPLPGTRDMVSGAFFLGWCLDWWWDFSIVILAT